MPVFKKAKDKEGPAQVACADPMDNMPVKQLDSRVGMDCYRDFYTLKNYWKTVQRKQKECAAFLMYRYLKSSPENISKYPRLKNTTLPDSVEGCSGDKTFEAQADIYLKMFADAIETIEETPADASAACERLQQVGRIHKSKVAGMKMEDFQRLEAPFLGMVEEVLQDRYNEKAETLFRKFFQFVLRYLHEGFNQ